MKLSKRIEALAEAIEQGYDLSPKSQQEIIPIRDEFREFVEWLKAERDSSEAKAKALPSYDPDIGWYESIADCFSNCLERLGEEKGDE